MTGKRRIPPLYNDMFLRVFGSEGSKAAALGLANAILRAAGIPELDRIDEISAEKSIPGGAVLKSPRLDVVVRCDDRIVDLEAQAYRADVYNKSLFYASKLIAANMTKDGDWRYRSIPQVIVVTLLDNMRMFEGDQYLTVGRIHWEIGENSVQGKPNPLFIVIELDKFCEMYNQLTEEVLASELLSWLYLLTRGYESEKEVNAMLSTFEAIKEFAREYGYALDDPNLERYYDTWYEARLEYNSTLDFAKLEGRHEGSKSTRAKDVAKLRELGVDEEVVAQIEALPIEEEPRMY